MNWEQIRFTKSQWKQIDEEMRSFRKRARFLVDENIPESLSNVLRRKGFNVRTVQEVGLAGRSDTDVAAYAKQNDRVLVTNDSDFCNERRFPLDGSPGIAVLSSTSHNMDFVRAFGNLMMVHGDSHELWRDQRIEFGGYDTLSIRYRDTKSLVWRTIKFKFPKAGPPQVWKED